MAYSVPILGVTRSLSGMDSFYTVFDPLQPICKGRGKATLPVYRVLNLAASIGPSVLKGQGVPLEGVKPDLAPVPPSLDQAVK